MLWPWDRLFVTPAPEAQNRRSHDIKFTGTLDVILHYIDRVGSEMG